MSCLLRACLGLRVHLPEAGLVTFCQQLAGVCVHLQSLLLKSTQPKALDVLLQLGNGVHGFEVAHGALLACAPAQQCKPGLQKGQPQARAPARQNWASS